MHRKDIQPAKNKIVYTVIFQKLEKFCTKQQFRLYWALLDIIRFFRNEHVVLIKTYSFWKFNKNVLPYITNK